jgi:glycosyltransferase involved in cell wall biosynthesis
VSIVTPLTQTGEVFCEIVRIVLSQSFQDWEWLIVSDAEAGADLPGAYRGQETRIRVIDPAERRGPGGTWSRGYAEARAEFVVQRDFSVLLEPAAIEEWLWLLAGRPAVAFVDGYRVRIGQRLHLWRHGFSSGSAFLEEKPFPAAFMVRRTVHGLVGGHDSRLKAGLADWDFWFRWAATGRWGWTAPEFLSWSGDDGRCDPRSDLAEAEVVDFLCRARGQNPKLFAAPGLPRVPKAEESPVATIPAGANPLAKRKRRLVLLSPWLVAGGVEKCNLDVIARLHARGWEVTLVASLAAGHVWHARFTELTPDVFVLSHFLEPGQCPAFVEYLVESRGADAILITHSEFAYTLLPALRARFPRISILDMNYIEEEDWRNGGYPRDSVDNRGFLDRQIVVSEHLRRWMVERGGDPSKISVCYLNVDERQWWPNPAARVAVRAELDIDPAIPVIVYAGRVCRQKQPRVLAATLNELARRELRFVALVAGDGEDMPALRREIGAGPAASRTRLLGLTPNSRVRQLMQAADLLFLPSEWEGIALGIYEAMACRLAIVGADVGGQRELVTSDCGALLPRSSEAGESAAYAEAISVLFGDPTRLCAMGGASRSRIEAHCPLELMGNRIAGLLEEVVAQGPRPALSHGLDIETARSRAVA